MAGERNLAPWPLSPGASKNEDSRSISAQTNIGLTSKRSRVMSNPSRTSSPAPSDSILPGPPSGATTTENSQSSTVPPDQPPAEDVLRDLIRGPLVATSTTALTNTLKDLKRRHEDEDYDPLDQRRPKRDRLGDELEEMHATLLDTSRTTTAATSRAEETHTFQQAASGDATAGSETMIPLHGGPPRQNPEASAPEPGNGHSKDLGDELSR